MRLIDADALRERLQSLAYDDWNQGVSTTWANAFSEIADMVDDQPSADVVPWELLERYADWFCALVSYPEFIREAKAFYISTQEAMKESSIKTIRYQSGLTKDLDRKDSIYSGIT